MGGKVHPLISLVILLFASNVQSGILHSSSSLGQAHHNLGSTIPAQKSYASTYTQYVPAQSFSAAYSNVLPGLQTSAIQSLPLPQPSYLNFNPSQNSLQNNYGSYSSAPIRQSLITHSTPITRPSYTNQISLPSQATYSSNANTFATPNSGSLPPVNSFVTSQSSGLNYPSLLNSQASYSSSINAIPAQSLQYSTSQSLKNPQKEHLTTYSVPHNDYHYLKQYKQSDYQFQTGSAPPSVQPVNYHLTHHQSQKHQSGSSASAVHQSGHTGRYQNQASSSTVPIVSTTLVHHNGNQHQVISGNNGYNYQASSPSISAPLTSTIIQQSSNQHHYQVPTSSISAPISTSIVKNQHTLNQHQYASGNNGYNYQIPSSSISAPISTSIVQNQHTTDHQYTNGNNGYNYQASYPTISAPVSTSIVQNQHNSHQHQYASGNNGYNYQVPSPTISAPISTSIVQNQHNSHQHQYASGNNGYNYQVPHSSISAPISTSIVQNQNNLHQHQYANGNNGYNHQAYSSLISTPVSSTVIQQSSNQNHLTSGNGYSPSSSIVAPESTIFHHKANGKSEGYQYQTGFRPIPSSDIHHEVLNSGHVENQLTNSVGINLQGTQSLKHSGAINFQGTQSLTHSGGINLQGSQSLTQSGGISLDDSYISGLNQEYSAPVVTKHIYFHAPPAEAEERPVQSIPVSSPKKTYNIIFIKAPTQQSTYRSGLQSLSTPQSQVEDKTLIYLLVKKPDPQEIVVPQAPQVDSQHEVFYVKYKGDIAEVSNQINENLSQQSSGAASSSSFQDISQQSSSSLQDFPQQVSSGQLQQSSANIQDFSQQDSRGQLQQSSSSLQDFPQQVSGGQPQQTSTSFQDISQQDSRGPLQQNSNSFQDFSQQDSRGQLQQNSASFQDFSQQVSGGQVSGFQGTVVSAPLVSQQSIQVLQQGPISLPLSSVEIEKQELISTDVVTQKLQSPSQSAQSTLPYGPH